MGQPEDHPVPEAKRQPHAQLQISRAREAFPQQHWARRTLHPWARFLDTLLRPWCAIAERSLMPILQAVSCKETCPSPAATEGQPVTVRRRQPMNDSAKAALDANHLQRLAQDASLEAAESFTVDSRASSPGSLSGSCSRVA